MDVWLAASANIFNSQIPRSGQKQAQAAENLGIPMEKQLACMGQKMDDRKIVGCGPLLSTILTKAAGCLPAA